MVNISRRRLDATLKKPVGISCDARLTCSSSSYFGPTNISTKRKSPPDDITTHLSAVKPAASCMGVVEITSKEFHVALALVLVLPV